jgi:hypothetical protein
VLRHLDEDRDQLEERSYGMAVDRDGAIGPPGVSKPPGTTPNSYRGVVQRVRSLASATFAKATFCHTSSIPSSVRHRPAAGLRGRSRGIDSTVGLGASGVAVGPRSGLVRPDTVAEITGGTSVDGIPPVIVGTYARW